MKKTPRVRSQSLTARALTTQHTPHPRLRAAQARSTAQNKAVLASFHSPAHRVRHAHCEEGRIAAAAAAAEEPEQGGGRGEHRVGPARTAPATQKPRATKQVLIKQQGSDGMNRCTVAIRCVRAVCFLLT